MILRKCGLLACYGLFVISMPGIAISDDTPGKCNKNVVDKHNANIERREALCTAAQAKVKEIQAAIALLTEATPSPSPTSSSKEDNEDKGKGKGKGKDKLKNLNNKLRAAQNSANAKCAAVQKSINALKKYEKKHCPTPTPTATPTATATPEATATPAV